MNGFSETPKHFSYVGQMIIGKYQVINFASQKLLVFTQG